VGVTDVRRPSAPEKMSARKTPTSTGQVLIIGSGFSGLGVAAMLDQAGLRDWLVLEQATEVGGTWRDNTYPGCACDIPSPLYSYSYAQAPSWNSLFAGQPEILDYLRRFADSRQLRSRIAFGRTVERATWDDGSDCWEIETADGSLYRYRYLVSGVGLLHRPNIPELAGLPEFRGRWFHSARWDHDYDLSGKRVAVVGTGASAIQFVPAIADTVASMMVFQRTPPWILPKANRAFSPWHKQLARYLPPYRAYHRARLYWAHEQRAEGFTDVNADTGAVTAFALRHLERQIPDPDLRAALTPDYALGCKRLLISSDFYPALSEPHVQLVADRVTEVLPHGVVDSAGTTYPVDCIILGTGFEAQDALSEVVITGRDGTTLDQAWAGGMQAYLGTTIPGFPNFFTMCGPNTGLGHNSQIVMIEAQARYLVRAIKASRRRGSPIEVRPEVLERFATWLDERMVATVWSAGGCTSWYFDDRTGKNTLLWPSTTVDFLRRTARLRRSDYRFG
jgi:cation diffusion facilitator CzcD-associated flavoprotein CzcO